VFAGVDGVNRVKVPLAEESDGWQASRSLPAAAVALAKEIPHICIRLLRSRAQRPRDVSCATRTLSAGAPELVHSLAQLVAGQRYAGFHWIFTFARRYLGSDIKLVDLETSVFFFLHTCQ
jgi:hypothetical protein